MPESAAGLVCSFCGTRREQADRFVAGGTGAQICDRCIALATQVVHEGAAKANERIVLSVLSAEARCSFCGRTLREARVMAGTASARICGECLALCVPVVEEIISEERHRELDRKFGRRPPGL